MKRNAAFGGFKRNGIRYNRPCVYTWNRVCDSNAYTYLIELGAKL